VVAVPHTTAGPLAPVALGVVAQALVVEMLLAALQIQVVVVVAQQTEPVAQAAPVSSSLNTTHPHNPSSHSKALASG